MPILIEIATTVWGKNEGLYDPCKTIKPHIDFFKKKKQTKNILMISKQWYLWGIIRMVEECQLYIDPKNNGNKDNTDL